MKKQIEKTAGTEKAIAFKYNGAEDKAPRVTAKGKGLIARKIIEIAMQNGIPVRSDADLVELLSEVELNQEIPPELYKVVAEVLAMIYRVNNKLQ